MKAFVFESMQLVDKDGYATPAFKNLMEQLFLALQTNFSDNGLVPPSQATAVIATLTNIAPFTIIGDTTTKLPKMYDPLTTSFKTISLV